MKKYHAQINLYGQRINYEIEAKHPSIVWRHLTSKVLELSKTGILVQSIIVNPA